jgi:hypothetical protein
MAVLAVVCGAMTFDPSAYGQPPKPLEQQPILPSRLPVAAAGDLMAFSLENPSGSSQITLIDVKTRTMSVYHIDRETGGIELRSVRQFHWDMLIEEFNGERPLPREIRDLIQQK